MRGAERGEHAVRQDLGKSARGAISAFLGYFIAAVFALLLLPIGIILMIVFTVTDFVARLIRRAFR